MFEFITIVLLRYVAVSMTIGGICFLSEPELDAGMGIYFFLRAVLGVVLMVKAMKK